MSQEGRGCLVGDQGGSDKVAQFKIEGLRSGSAVPPWIRACNYSQRVWKQNGILSFINFILLLKNIYISYKHCIESNNKIND